MKRLLSVTALTGLLTLLKMSAGFVIAKVIAVYTGPTGLAVLGQFQNAVGVVNGVVIAPVGSGVVRYTAENIDDGIEACSPWWKASLQWSFLAIAIIAPLLCLFSSDISLWIFKNKTYDWLIILSAVLLPLTALNTAIISIINGQQKYKQYITLSALSVIGSSIIMITLIYLANIQGALIAAAITSSIAGCIMILGVLKEPWFKLKFLWGATDLTHKKKIGGYMLMAITSAITVPISLILVRDILVTNFSWDIAGQWQAVWKISEAYLSIITISLSTYYLPRLSSLKTAKEIRKEIHRTAMIILPIVIMLATGIYLCRDIIIHLLFTNKFQEATQLFAIQLCGDVVKILAWLYAFPMLSKGATKWFISTEIIFASSFPLLTYFLVPIYGIQGVTMAFLINYIIYFCVIFLNLKKILK